ncbi:hypothetical protein L7E55_07450 [Pelotomaculum isophthalicicum JI]|uniref:Uncharacterized protein n=1 Tax=Pelotomaculum isophthalicicum JI TaxID=947010 RepID=A0A9X4H7Y9_9FIRM|nr:hypothetical protein [Pelotomaculum isophthalicicum]MDF9408194.1 hypothetical protein [Pelotomaculum isophthalicicum JI]
MQTVLVKVTARRTKSGLETVRREVVGHSSEDAGQHLDRLAGILTDLFMTQIDKSKKEVAASGQ